MTLFLMKPASSSWLGAHNGMPLPWLISTPTNECNTPQTFGFKQKPMFQIPMIRDSMLAYMF
jgi:hypothetical protein